ncbi:MAG: carboxylesterase family protein [Gammaproteobacteria bacterium]|nr:carboxylesterase family protein [Gammaproteobacteria bacterium]
MHKGTQWLALAALGLLVACGPAETSEAPAPSPIGTTVAVTGGTVQGFVGEDGLKQYHRIPYAAAPTGARRWAPPAAVEPWDGVRDATAPGPKCVQPAGQGGSFYGDADFEVSEDCLVLNVWTRAAHEDEGLPVMVWIHGGALVTGAGSDYPGELLSSKGVVLVTANYRLGPFGFFALPELSAESPAGVSGNQGIRDQVAALEWVRDNIARFGGDPGNVTIFGESAGALSMSLLQASPLARGLFHRVIGQSGGAFQPMAFRDRMTSYGPSVESRGQEIATALAGEDGDDSLAGLRALSAEHVLAVYEANPALWDYGSLAIVDGEVVPDEVATIFAEGRQADVPVMIGSTADEGTTLHEFIVPPFGEGAAGFEAYANAVLPEAGDALAALYPSGTDDEAHASGEALLADVLFTAPMRLWARAMEDVESDAYLYWFTWAPPIEEAERYGAFHAAEIGYVFGNLDLFGAVPVGDDRAFSDLMATIWTQFARSGNPNGDGLPAWPAYTGENEAYMELGVDTGAKSHIRVEEVALIAGAWDERRETEGRSHHRPDAAE